MNTKITLKLNKDIINKLAKMQADTLSKDINSNLVKLSIDQFKKLVTMTDFESLDLLMEMLRAQEND